MENVIQHGVLDLIIWSSRSRRLQGGCAVVVCTHRDGVMICLGSIDVSNYSGCSDLKCLGKTHALSSRV